MPTQLLRMQKNQLIDLKQNLESYVNLLPVFGFNSGKFDLNLTMSYLIPHLINDIEAEPMFKKRLTVSYPSNLETYTFIQALGGATDNFLKAYRSSETKEFPYEWFDSAEELEN